MKRRTWSLVGLVALLALAACSPAASQPAGAPAAGATGGAATPAADFGLSMYPSDAFSDGQSLRFADLLRQGKPVVLNFWAGQCPPCRAEMPDFQRVYQARKGEVLLVGVDVGRFVGLGDEDDARRLLRDLRITYPTGSTPDARVVQDYRVLGMPTTVFIDREGRVVDRFIGVLNAQALETRLDALLR